MSKEIIAYISLAESKGVIDRVIKIIDDYNKVYEKSAIIEEMRKNAVASIKPGNKQWVENKIRYFVSYFEILNIFDPLLVPHYGRGCIFFTTQVTMKGNQFHMNEKSNLLIFKK